MKSVARAVRAAFPHTIPVLTGYLFLGMAFGILLESKGYGPLWALGMSLFVYAGSMQFVAVGLLAGGFHPFQALLLTLMVNARHLFYGLAMLGRYRDKKAEKPYMVFALTDETFSLLCAVDPPPEVEPRLFDLCLAAMNQIYWVTGSLLGALAGSAISFNTRGIEFVMTALFVVIFLEQWRSGKGRKPAMIGLASALVCRLLFGASWFLLPTMAVLTVVLIAGQKPLEGGKQP